jgi:hypothetical protein
MVAYICNPSYSGGGNQGGSRFWQKVREKNPQCGGHICNPSYSGSTCERTAVQGCLGQKQEKNNLKQKGVEKWLK